MAEKIEIFTRARLITSAAQLGGKHLKGANEELRSVQTQFTVAEYNALLLAIRMYNLQDRRDNLRLPKLIFAVSSGGAIPDSIVPHHDNEPHCSPQTEAYIRAALLNLGRAAAEDSLTATYEQSAPVHTSAEVTSIMSAVHSASSEFRRGSEAVAPSYDSTCPSQPPAAKGTGIEYFMLSPDEMLTFTNESLLPDAVSP